MAPVHVCQSACAAAAAAALSFALAAIAFFSASRNLAR